MKPFTKSEPIPEVNDDPVKVVVADSLHDVVFNSGKNGLYLSTSFIFLIYLIYMAIYVFSFTYLGFLDLVVA